ncbi:nicotinamide-nucleotide amidase [Thiolapillus brandeum]|uniref:Competence damage-inducible protein A n=1 Tax=Thiolapillus brandeum TaxID=1076588 RepID=A0A7U6GJR3_9GAMM|nr:nicotinamide-nucleotide amidase [Thiolapillus brandeum]BAO44855.1 competence damage-inducible protein A [Thiolapillus brandeum]
MQDAQLEQLARETGRRLEKHQLFMVTAESCTGGWIAKVMTDIPGSSGWFEGGFVTYSNQAKMDMLGVRPDTLDQFGAVSEQVVLQMATGALANSRADVSVAVSGVAGPGGGTPDKPVGTVWFAWGNQSGIRAERCWFPGNREQVRRQTVIHALDVLGKSLGE